ncbi:hypothetical protein BT63DRAFT_478596 [Microthyrium microscopicum]|uniref:Uncharacterized protein n=1 Tax=Microthyrium microscopicum TaxID=703497 RepID=A0A6A6UG61_9PEZI|nr:hypothetical protein BT63DRAFT_478596 [Microthyrium microscopicum]
MANPDNVGTVIATKTKFLNDQIRNLSEELTIPDDFEEQSDIPEKVLHVIINKLNRVHDNHMSTVYLPTGVRSVAEQIDTLYWEAATPSGFNEEAEAGRIRKTDDLTKSSNIDKLTEDFSTGDEYSQQFKELKLLSQRRKEAQRKLERYRRLQSELEFLKNPKNTIQPNLAAKTGPLAEELEKTRNLANRVAGRVAGMKHPLEPEDDNDENDKYLKMSEDEKLKAILDED